MKTLAILALLLGSQDDAEAKKKRLGILMRQMQLIQGEARKLMDDLTGGDPTKLDAIMREVVQKYAPELAGEIAGASIAANERNASFTLKTFATAQADFRSNDRDANRLNDFWVGDVSGLYRIDAGEAIKLIEESAAAADARPCVPLDKAGSFPAGKEAAKFVALGKPAPKAGYWFAAVPSYEDETGATVKYDQGNGRNASMFGFCTYPAEHPKTGKFTYLISEYYTVWKKDTGGKPVELMPQDLRKAGWTKVD
jgi:hypothetical protein